MPDGGVTTSPATWRCRPAGRTAPPSDVEQRRLPAKSAPHRRSGGEIGRATTIIGGDSPGRRRRSSTTTVPSATHPAGTGHQYWSSMAKATRRPARTIAPRSVVATCLEICSSHPLRTARLPALRTRRPMVASYRAAAVRSGRRRAATSASSSIHICSDSRTRRSLVVWDEVRLGGPSGRHQARCQVLARLPPTTSEYPRMIRDPSTLGPCAAPLPRSKRSSTGSRCAP